MKVIKSSKINNALFVKKLLSGLVLPRLEEIPRDKRRVRVTQKVFKASKDVVEKIKQNELSWMQHAERRRSHNVVIKQVAVDLFDEMSTPVKFSKS